MHTDITNANMYQYDTVYICLHGHPNIIIKEGSLLNACTTTAISLWQTVLHIVAIQ